MRLSIMMPEHLARPIGDGAKSARRCRSRAVLLQAVVPGAECNDHAGSGDYLVAQDKDGTLGQDNWRWCKKCQVLAFAGNPNVGNCASGGMHDHTGSGNYVLAQVTDCSSFANEVNSLHQQITNIQSSAGYIQGKQDSQPGKPNPEMLAQVKTLEKQAGIENGKLSACELGQNKTVLDAVCDTKQCVSISQIYSNITARLDGKVVGYSCSVGRSLSYQSHGFANIRIAARVVTILLTLATGIFVEDEKFSAGACRRAGRHSCPWCIRRR